MLRWIFKKKDNVAAAVPAVAVKPAKTAKPAKSPAPPAPPPSPPAPIVDWAARLEQTRGDDGALLALMQTAAAPLAIRQAAVEALEGEAALQQAEREARNRDRRVHQIAKRRWLATVAARQTREQAAQLIEAARELASQPDAPLNRGVELDRAWQALDPVLVDSVQREAFDALTSQLTQQARQVTDLERQRKRWHSDAQQALQQLKAACAEAAEGTLDRPALAAVASASQALLEAQPVGDAAAAPDAARAALERALQVAAALDVHLGALDALLAGPQEQAPAADDADPPQAQAAPAPAPTSPEPLPPLPDAHLATLLDARLTRWQQEQQQAQHEAHQQRRDLSRERQRARKGEFDAAMAEAIAQTETALDEGQLSDAHRHLSGVEDTLQGGDPPDALRARLAAVQERLAKLRGWQHWAGGRARDELVAQAEALAAATLSRVTAGGAEPPGDAEAEFQSQAEAPVTAEPDAPAAPVAPVAPVAVPAPVTSAAASSATLAEVARLSLRQRADVIATLRERWKEVDRLGGAGGRALWLRFDAALKTAGEPLAAHAAAQRVARETNLAARRQLLDVLEATGADESVQAQVQATAIDRFRVAWRKLGPVEHTTPRAAQAALAERMAEAVRRVEGPLQAARQSARAEREVLVARARALTGENGGLGRNVAGDLRLLQDEWQRQAKALTLGRADEQALWAEFKAAIDAGFAAREAAFNARDAEFEAHAAERQALIERLRVRPEDNLATQRRALTEVEAAWQRCGPAPRARAQALEADFRTAREALRQWLGEAAQRDWLATCDALAAKLALCEAREQGADAAAADLQADVLDASWQALPLLPAPLEQALRQRAGLGPAQAVQAGPPTGELLLQIETAWDLPTPPAFESARRERKLLALKTALEGRRTGAAEAVTPERALTMLLGRSGLDDAARARLATVLAAWRKRGLPARAIDLTDFARTRDAKG
jgi:hypothetical protein